MERWEARDANRSDALPRGFCFPRRALFGSLIILCTVQPAAKRNLACMLKLKISPCSLNIKDVKFQRRTGNSTQSQSLHQPTPTPCQAGQGRGCFPPGAGVSLAAQPLWLSVDGGPGPSRDQQHFGSECVQVVMATAWGCGGQPGALRAGHQLFPPTSLEQDLLNRVSELASEFPLSGVILMLTSLILTVAP